MIHSSVIKVCLSKILYEHIRNLNEVFFLFENHFGMLLFVFVVLLKITLAPYNVHIHIRSHYRIGSQSVTWIDVPIEFFVVH